MRFKEIMLINSVDGERSPSGTYHKAPVDEAIQELVDALKTKDDTIRKIISESLSKQNEAIVFENKMAERIKELTEVCRELEQKLMRIQEILQKAKQPTKVLNLDWNHVQVVDLSKFNCVLARWLAK